MAIPLLVCALVLSAVTPAVTASATPVGPTAADGQPPDATVGATLDGPDDDGTNETDDNPEGDDNEPPLVDAGLDQRVVQGARVYLDGRGSRDPDGRIADVEWTVETPSDGTTAVDCPDCIRTSFTPTEVGEYAVTLTVTDDDGATRSDTLYVTVTPGGGPTVSVRAPSSARVDTNVSAVAAVRSGSTDLAYLVWRVDGRRVANQSLSGETASDTVDVTPSAPGNLSITATAYTESGRRATGRAVVTVDGSPLANPVDPPTPDPGDDAANYDPIISGPTLVTGDPPLTATYSLRDAGPAGEVRSVEWIAGSRSVATGTGTERTWSPGRHRFYAVVTYADGSKRVAAFPDGSTVVVADPRPTVSLPELTGDGRVTGRVTASDGFDNLAEVFVTVDGDVAYTSQTGQVGPVPVLLGGSLSAPFSYTPRTNGTYTVVATAVDERGQRATVERSVRISDPAGSPRNASVEILDSGFVNGPVDSYHRRIDPDRYAAHHVLEIEVENADPGSVTVTQTGDGKESAWELSTHQYHQTRSYDPSTGTLRIDTYWVANKPGLYSVDSTVQLAGEDAAVTSDAFEITPSPPEVRIKFVKDGTEFRTGDWGAKIDASGSFDPDKTSLKYDWGWGAEDIKGKKGWAKLNSVRRAKLIIKDRNNQETVVKERFLRFFSPSFGTVEVTADQPIAPNDTVQIRIKSRPFTLTKHSFKPDIRLEVIGDGYVVDWKRIEWGPEGELEERPQSARDSYRAQMVGTVEVEASALLGENRPKVRMYHADRPHESRTTTTLPRVEANEPTRTFLENVSVEDVEYVVERERNATVTATSKLELQGYRSDGYELTETRSAPAAMVIEKEVIVEKQRTVEKEFEDRRERDVLVSTSRGWTSAGTRTETETYTERVSEWRDSRLAIPAFTGNTRRVVDDPAEYETLREYRSTNRVGPGRGGTYWASSPRTPSDRFTGRTKTQQVSPPEYTTQYEYAYEKTKTRTERLYLAKQTVVDTTTEWRRYTTMDDLDAARNLAQREGYRIGETTDETEWILEKEQRTVVQATYENPKTVEKTVVTVSADLKQKFYDAEDSETSISSEGEVTRKVIFYGAVDKKEVMRRIHGSDCGKSGSLSGEACGGTNR